MMKVVLATVLALGIICWGLNAQNEKRYDPEVFALESGRGQLSKEYFGVKLADVKKDEKGQYLLTDSQRETVARNILGDHPCSLQWISWKKFGKVTISEGSDGRICCRGGQNGDDGDYLKIDGYVLKLGPMVATTKFSMKMDAPIAAIMKYRLGAFLSLSGLYASFSRMTATAPQPIEAIMNATIGLGIIIEVA